MQGEIIEGFAGSPDVKRAATAHLAAARDGIATLRADDSVPPGVVDVLVHLHDAVVATASMVGVSFYE